MQLNQKLNTPAPTNDGRSVGILLAIGILLMPYIFSWLTLRKGHSNNARVISFLWLVTFLIITHDDLKSTLTGLGIGMLIGLVPVAFSLRGKNGKKHANSSEVGPKPLSEADRIRAIAAARKDELAQRSLYPPLLAVHMGGTGTNIPEGETVYIGSSSDKFIILSAINNYASEILLSDLMSVEISGPGTQTTNAGLIGGGFGLEGAAKGMLAAALVNAATTKTTTNTFLRVATNNSEALFHFNDQEPSKLRLTLSHLFVAAEANKAPKAVSTNSISDELTKLQSLKEVGVLSEEEFSIAKQKLLS